jgi:hypothetical protein
MGRRPLRPDQVKKVRSIRLTTKKIQEIEKIDKLQTFIEESIEIYLKIRQNEQNYDK